MPVLGKEEIEAIQEQVSNLVPPASILVPPASILFVSRRVNEICKGKDEYHIDVLTLQAIINDTNFNIHQLADALTPYRFSLLVDAHSLAEESGGIFFPSTMTQIIQQKLSLQALFNSPIQEKSLELCYALAQATSDASYLTQPIIDLWYGYFNDYRDVKFKALVLLFRESYPQFSSHLYKCLTASDSFIDFELSSFADEELMQNINKGIFDSEISNRIWQDYTLTDIEKRIALAFDDFNNFFAPDTAGIQLRNVYIAAAKAEAEAEAEAKAGAQAAEEFDEEEFDEEPVEEFDEEFDEASDEASDEESDEESVEEPNSKQEDSNMRDVQSNTIGMITGMAAGMLMLSLPFWLPTLIMVSATVLTLLDVVAAVGVVITGACAYQLSSDQQHFSVASC